MNIFRADLHTHTTCSDGSFTPTELIRHAADIGLTGLSITDHDTTLAYREAIPVAKELGIRLGAGVEFSSMHEGVSVHVLGYDIDLTASSLHAFCRRHIKRRLNRNRSIAEKLEKMGMPIDLDPLEKEVRKERPIGRPHLAQAMLDRGYVSSIQEAFVRYIGDGMPAFCRGDPITTEETIELIHAVGGKAFIAHPHLIKQKKAIKSLLNFPFDGLEVYYALMPSDREEKWRALVSKHNLLASGGSDFHGKVKEHLPLGCSWVDEETFDKIFTKEAAL